jgi:ATP-dependent DNA helicase DinG
LNKYWNKYFPYEKHRDQQEVVIDKVIDEFKTGKKYAIVECGTGVGKSAIGLTIARTINNSSEYPGIYIDGSYFLTTQKVLQKQYEDDFSKFGLVSLYSSSNYTCAIDKKASCKDIQTALRSKSIAKKYDKCNYNCLYKKKKQNFIDKDLGITNFSYFLTEKNYSKKIPNKKVLIIDEAHNLENELSRFIEISISSYFSNKILKLKLPKDINTQFKAFNWIKNIYLNSVSKKVSFMSTQLQKFGITSTKLEEFKKITNNFEMLSSHHKKIEQFIEIYDKDNWIFDIEESESNYKKLVFKPIDVSAYSKQYLLDHADYIIFMSATIISHEGFIQTIGLPKDKTISIKEGSPFDTKNRPIIFSPAGSMSAKNIDKTLPVMKEMVKSILENHKNEKGIIHTHNTRIAKYLFDNIKDKRLILAYGKNRDSSLEKHIRSKNNTVLISPSMAEGVDLKGDLSSFQVICKVPFPYLGDKVTRKKMNKWKWWYDTQTVRSIVQSLGRSIRSENDKAVTYILDGDWHRIKSKSKENFPENFFENYYEY